MIKKLTGSIRSMRMSILCTLKLHFETTSKGLVPCKENYINKIAVDVKRFNNGMIDNSCQYPLNITTLLISINHR